MANWRNRFFSSRGKRGHWHGPKMVRMRLIRRWRKDLNCFNVVSLAYFYHRTENSYLRRKLLLHAQKEFEGVHIRVFHSCSFRILGFLNFYRSCLNLNFISSRKFWGLLLFLTKKKKKKKRKEKKRKEALKTHRSILVSTTKTFVFLVSFFGSILKLFMLTTFFSVSISQFRSFFTFVSSLLSFPKQNGAREN